MYYPNKRRRLPRTPFEIVNSSVITRPPPPVATGQIEEAPMPETAAEAEALLLRDPGLIARALAEARAIYAKISRAENFCVQHADREMQSRRRAMVDKPPGEQLLLALELRDRAEFWAASDPRTWPALAAAHQSARIASQPPTTAPAFNAAPLIAALAARGVTLTITDGRIRAQPSGMLNPVDRAMLAQHRSEIIEALSQKEEF